jgi:hypothetical protein
LDDKRARKADGGSPQHACARHRGRGIRHSRRNIAGQRALGLDTDWLYPTSPGACCARLHEERGLSNVGRGLVHVGSACCSSPVRWFFFLPRVVELEELRSPLRPPAQISGAPAGVTHKLNRLPHQGTQAEPLVRHRGARTRH